MDAYEKSSGMQARFPLPATELLVLLFLLRREAEWRWGGRGEGPKQQQYRTALFRCVSPPADVFLPFLCPPPPSLLSLSQHLAPVDDTSWLNIELCDNIGEGSGNGDGTPPFSCMCGRGQR